MPCRAASRPVTPWSASEVPLDAVAAQPVRGGVHVTLRWILNHLIEETARRNGHLVILRELADGTTGM